MDTKGSCQQAGVLPCSRSNDLEVEFEKAKLDDPSAILLDMFDRKVFRVDQKVIKFGRHVNPDEAKTMLFLARTVTSVPIPRLWNFETCEDGTVIIEMEMIQGESLSDLWPKLVHEEKKKIALQLNGILCELRSLKGTYIGAVDHGPASDLRRALARGGPFFCEVDFNNWLIGNVISKAPAIYRRMLHQAMSETHEIVLTHADLRPANIIVRDGAIVALLDWEVAGWYPEYWDFVQFFRDMDRKLDFHNYAEVIFPQLYPHELMTNSFLGRMTQH